MYSGLSSAQAELLLKENGFNEIPERKVSFTSKIGKKLISPIALMLILASGLSFVLDREFDGFFILILLILNIAITMWQENKADNAIRKLNANLEEKIKVFRDDKWIYIASRLLVVGDVVQLSSGDLIPADGKVIEANHVSVNESSLTGESLPKDKIVGDSVFSGSFISSGIAVIEITAIGAKTNFSKTLFSVERVMKKSLLEKDIINISKFLTIFSLSAVVILTTIFILRGESVLEIIALDLSLIIAGIPISLPTVMTLIIELGVLALATKKVIVRRLSALEDLANVNFLLTDKTGTLTKNKITIQDVYAYHGFTHNDVLAKAAMIASSESDNPIDKAILEKAGELQLKIPDFKKLDFTTADSKRKRSTIVISKDGQDMVITVGAPQIVLSHCVVDERIEEKFNREVDTLAGNGYRALAVAISDGRKEENMKIVGLLALSDTIRPDAKSVSKFLEENGIDVTMITGDNRAIASQMVKQLDLDDGTVITKEQLDRMDWKKMDDKFFHNTGAFAEVLPEDKLRLVQKADTFFVIASTGDGINDLPAIKAANVGIAVKNAVTALKASADIVLLSEGVSVIRDAIIESRKIFERLHTYSIYRISESLRIIVTIAVLGIFFGEYPMTALQIILIALLNDVHIISLAFDRVNIAKRPEKIDVKGRFILSSVLGLVGVANTILLLIIMSSIWHLDWYAIQTMFFLKLTISGHLLIYVVHTKHLWWKFLPSKHVLISTMATQIIATILAFTGFLMPGELSLIQICFVWIWAMFWMQVCEGLKYFLQKQKYIS